MSSRLGPERPFPGLRPYSEADREWFFGRSKETLALYRLLDIGRLVAVVGGSGSGKSSLVRAGLLPLLAKETDSDGGRQWCWWGLRPGDAPIARLADALAGDQSEEELAGRVRAARRERIDFALRKSSFGLIDAVRNLEIAAGTTPFLLIDQFEELFRFADLPGTEAARAGRREEATAFVQLVLEAAQSSDSPIRIVLTMRSDYLGDCARFHGLPEAVTGSQFLVPSLTRDQREEAIREPIRRADGTITNDLVERLLNDSNEEFDQLPVLQHALMRMWNYGERGTSQHLTLADYSAIGGVRGAIDQHAEWLMTRPELAGHASATEQVFRALVDVDRRGRAVRRPLPFAQLIAETGLDVDAARRVVGRFSQSDCCFIFPEIDNIELTPSTIVDIGHEALIRRWARLGRPPVPNLSSEERREQQGWLWSEVEDGRIFQAMATLAEPTIGCPRPLLPPEQARERWRWWSERRRTEAWAERHGGRLAPVQALLDHSREECARLEEQRIREAVEKERAQQERLLAAEQLAAAEGRARAVEAERRAIAEQKANDQRAYAVEMKRKAKLLRRWVYVSATCAIASVIFMLFAMSATERAEREAANSFVNATWSMFRSFGRGNTDIEGLWRIARSNPYQRKVFLELAFNDDNISRLVARGPEIIRALGLRQEFTRLQSSPVGS